MSNSHLMEWFDQLLFGHSDPCDPPLEFKNLILRMECENIPWQYRIRHGGLTEFPYQIHGDLNSLIDYLEKQWTHPQPFHPPLNPPPFKTLAVSKFWNQLQVLLARRLEPPIEKLPTPSKQDDDILKEILAPSLTERNPNFDFQSAPFWGQVARKFILIQRPENVSPLPPISEQEEKRIVQLYHMTRLARGRIFDPLTMHLVHPSEYLNAVFWQTGQNLSSFIRDQPTHALSLSVQSLLKKSLEQVLHGKKPSILIDSCPQLDAFLYNINKIHESIEQVPNEEAPPKLIDTFQRILALYHHDGLWEKTVPHIEPEAVSPSLLYLTEQVRILEREKRIVLKQVYDEKKWTGFNNSCLRHTHKK